MTGPNLGKARRLAKWSWQSRWLDKENSYLLLKSSCSVFSNSSNSMAVKSRRKSKHYVGGGSVGCGVEGGVGDLLGSIIR